MRGHETQAKSQPLTFIASMIALVCASAFAGAMVWPLVTASSSATPEAEIAVLLEHATVDIRAGRGAAIAERLGELVPDVDDVTTKERLLALWGEAAMQARDYRAAEEAARGREALVSDPKVKLQLQLLRIGLHGEMGHGLTAEKIADGIIASTQDPAVVDATRLRLMAAIQTREELAAWAAELASKAAAAQSAAPPTDDAAPSGPGLPAPRPALQAGAEQPVGDDAPAAEDLRLAGLAALRILSDPKLAEQLLSAAYAHGLRDVAVSQGLADAYSALGKHAELARVLGELKSDSPQAQARLAFRRVQALAAAKEIEAALTEIENVRQQATDFDIRQAARRLRYELLAQGDGLEAEIAAIVARGDEAERAFIALEIERDYGLANKLYAELAAQNPDSLAYNQALTKAAGRLDQEQRKAIYGAALQKDPNDKSALAKYLAAVVALGEQQEASKVVNQMLKGREQDPGALVEIAKLLIEASLANDAVEILKRAASAESDPLRQQQIQLIVADVYAGAKQVDAARRMYSDLTVTGASREIREVAMGRLAALL